MGTLSKEMEEEESFNGGRGLARKRQSSRSRSPEILMKRLEERKEDMASYHDAGFDSGVLDGRGMALQEQSDRIQVLSARVKSDVPDRPHTVTKSAFSFARARRQRQSPPSPPLEYRCLSLADSNVEMQQSDALPPPPPPPGSQISLAPPLPAYNTLMQQSWVSPPPPQINYYSSSLPASNAIMQQSQGLPPAPPPPMSHISSAPPIPASNVIMQKSQALPPPPPPPMSHISSAPPIQASIAIMQQSQATPPPQPLQHFYKPPSGSPLSGMAMPPPHSQPLSDLMERIPPPPSGGFIPLPQTRGARVPPPLPQSDLLDVSSSSRQLKSKSLSTSQPAPPVSGGFHAVARRGGKRTDKTTAMFSKAKLSEEKPMQVQAALSWRAVGLEKPARYSCKTSVADEIMSDMWVQDKGDAEESEQLLEKRMSRIKYPLRKLHGKIQVDTEPPKTRKATADFGIGSKIPHVVQKTVTAIQMNPDLIDTLVSLQLPDGHWEFSEKLEKVLGLSSQICLQGLYAAGLKSLGHMVTTDIEAMVTTVLVIFILLKMHSPASFPIDFSEWNWKQKVMKIVDGLTPVELKAIVLKAVSYYETIEKSYPWVSGTLELGHNWFHVAQKMVEC